MSLLEPEPDPADPRRLSLEGARTADRLRTLSLVRLAAPLGDGPSPARVARAVAQELADRAAQLAGRPRRVLPDLPDSAVGDVLAVCVNDLVEQLQEGGDDAQAASVCSRAVAELRQLRLQL